MPLNGSIGLDFKIFSMKNGYFCEILNTLYFKDSNKLSSKTTISKEPWKTQHRKPSTAG